MYTRALEWTRYGPLGKGSCLLFLHTFWYLHFHKTFSSYNTALKIKKKQDEYCSRAIAGKWNNIGEFPEDLQWEALIDVLRGRVKVI
jgi:hypothetical protein